MTANYCEVVLSNLKLVRSYFDSNDGKSRKTDSLLQCFCNAHMYRQMDYIETGRIACSNSFWRKSIQIMRRALGAKAMSLLDGLHPQISVVQRSNLAPQQWKQEMAYICKLVTPNRRCTCFAQLAVSPLARPVIACPFTE